MDYFFLGVVTNNVGKNPKAINETKNDIQEAFKDIKEDRNLCRTVCHGVLDTCEKCYKVDEEILST